MAWSRPSLGTGNGWSASSIARGTGREVEVATLTAGLSSFIASFSRAAAVVAMVSLALLTGGLVTIVARWRSRAGNGRARLAQLTGLVGRLHRERGALETIALCMAGFLFFFCFFFGQNGVVLDQSIGPKRRRST
ncbi:hypothetical protein ACOSQ3_017156 [Xanthoceras sorbifolium]